MNARDQLAVLIALISGCSLHSLDYLQQHEDSLGNGGLVGLAEAGGAGSPPVMGGPGGSPVVAEAGAAGNDAPASRCDDREMSGDEADVDCGGRSCQACAAGSRCAMGSDCSSAICTNQVCQPPSCTDLTRNGDETDLNCGGSCAPCSTGYACIVGADCKTGQCLGSVCTTPNCEGATRDDACPALVDNTAYFLSPAHAPASCIDVVGLGVDSGVEMQQYACNGRVNQTFWAVAGPSGSFALRNALSGKCLQARANSRTDGGLIEQASCSGKKEQLFSPSSDSSRLKLVLQSSGLSLDVAGDSSASSGQSIVQSVDDGSLDMRWSAVKAAGSGLLTLNALGQPGVLLRHVANQIRAGISLGPDSQWKVEPGLASSACVSFESADEPGAYLRHSNFLLWTDLFDGSLGFSKDATFCFRAALSGADGSSRALESFNYPGNYVSASDGRVRLLPYEDNPQFRKLATWVTGERP